MKLESLNISKPVYELSGPVACVWTYTFVFTQSILTYKLDLRLDLKCCVPK
jgi:hypothetical protein